MMIRQFVCQQLFRQLDRLHTGSLQLITPDGQSRTFAGQHPGEAATLQIHDWCVVGNMLRKGDIGFAEDYRAGHWETDNLGALLTLVLSNRSALHGLISGSWLSRLYALFCAGLRRNSLRGSKKNIQAHYDLGNAFYRLWLDPSMTYSAAIFQDQQGSLQQGSLQQAQYRKYDRILARLPRASGRLLEIGCGWGGFAERAQHQGDFDLKGITLSAQQHDYARHRLADKATIALEDYRHQTGRFDHIVSIEMFEAVGERYWPTYFKKIAALLHKKGKAVVQTILINEAAFPHYRRSSDFIRNFIFPGGMLPSFSRFQAEAARAGLQSAPAFYFGQCYARTLADWLARFEQQRDQVRALGFDEGFIRLWRFYLSACMAGFKTGYTNVMQVELSHG